MKPLFFSIIIPALNEEKYLPKLLDDLSKQTCTDFEVIIVDGKSEDKTVEKCLEYQNKFSAFRILTSIKRNVSSQRNLGAQKAGGEWIIFMDADNRLPTYFLDGIKYRVLSKNPDCFTTYCDFEGLKPADKTLIKFINLSLEVTNMIDTPTALGSMIGIRKSLFANYGGFDPSIGFAEDTAYVKHLFELGANYMVFKDPRFTWSLRHYQKDGKLEYLRNTAKLYLKKWAGKKINQAEEYPMGGF